MVTENLQMMSFAFPEGEAPTSNKRTHRHYVHPASIWMRKTKDNFEWAIVHGLALAEEYQRCYKRRHASQDKIEWVEKNYHYLSFSESGQTPFARCFSGFKQELDATELDTVRAYRRFYFLDKEPFARWPSLKEIPEWWPEISEKYVDKAFVNGVYSLR